MINMKQEMTLKFKLRNGKFVKIYTCVEEHEDTLYIKTKIGNRLPETLITHTENLNIISEK